MLKKSIFCFLFCILTRVTSYCVSNLTYTSSGDLDINTILYDCASNISNGHLPPSYFTKNTTNVVIGMVVNNLINVDNINSQVTMDFYFRMSWTDPRVALPPEVFESLNPENFYEGIELSYFIRDPAVPLKFWLPDIVFYQSISTQSIAELIELRQNGSLFWSQHLLVTFAEPQMYFGRYPLDQQNFSIVVQSYAFDTNFIQISLPDEPISFNYDNQQLTNYVNENQIWKYQSSSAYVVPELLPSAYNSHRQFSTVYLNLLFSRQSYGIIWRMALPVTIFLIIVGFSFWAEIDKRIDITLSILLVVAALYLVVGQVIPLVGYLTTIDQFINLVFILLTILVIIHFITFLLNAKAYKNPVDIFHRDLIVYVFRSIWIPMMGIIYIKIFQVTINYMVGTVFTLCVMGGIHAIIKFRTLEGSLATSIILLRFKAARLEFKAKEELARYERENCIINKQSSTGGGDVEDGNKKNLTKEVEDKEKALSDLIDLSFVEKVYLYFMGDWFMNQEMKLYQNINKRSLQKQDGSLPMKLNPQDAMVDEVLEERDGMMASLDEEGLNRIGVDEFDQTLLKSTEMESTTMDESTRLNASKTIKMIPSKEHYLQISQKSMNAEELERIHQMNHPSIRQFSRSQEGSIQQSIQLPQQQRSSMDFKFLSSYFEPISPSNPTPSTSITPPSPMKPSTWNPFYRRKNPIRNGRTSHSTTYMRMKNMQYNFDDPDYGFEVEKQIERYIGRSYDM